jgi:sec-independent protein translocase protein TatA
MILEPAFLGNIGPGELVLIFLVLLLVFGPRLPEVGRSLGIGIKEFKDGLKGEPGEKKPDAPAAKQEPANPNENKGNRAG